MSYPAASLLAALAASQVCSRSAGRSCPPSCPPFAAFQCGVRGAVGRVSIRARLGSARLGGGGCCLPTFSRCSFKIRVQEVEQESPPFLDLPQRVPPAAAAAAAADAADGHRPLTDTDTSPTPHRARERTGLRGRTPRVLACKPASTIPQLTSTRR